MTEPATPMTEQDKIAADREFIAWACRGDQDACALLDVLGYVAHLWDDLVDRDRERAPEEITRAFWALLVDLPANPFWLAHAGQLIPVLREGINAWLDANQLEQRDDLTSRAQAYSLRTAYNQLLTTCAYLVGGFPWMRTVSMAIRDNRSLTDGTFREYLKALEQGG